MARHVWVLVLAAACLALGPLIAPASGQAAGASSPPVAGPPGLHAPAGVRIDLFASELPGARHMAFDDDGNLFLSQMREGRVVALPDRDRDGRADETVVILGGRRLPHGLAFAAIDGDTYLYVAEEDAVLRMKRLSPPFGYGEPQKIIAGLPTGGHVSRTVRIKDGRLYLSVGSSCNVCVERDGRRAAVTRYGLEGGEGETFARGLRNTVGMEFSPWTGELWGVNNGRDWLGDDHPREELNVIREGRHYGWPSCYEERVADPEYGGLMDCAETEAPIRTFTAHMAPLGMAFYVAGTLPAVFERSLFIAFHGSWNRSEPAGYKVVRLSLSGAGDILAEEDFVTGWRRQDGVLLGRPVDVEVSPRGDLFVSDDLAGAVYRLTSGASGKGE